MVYDLSQIHVLVVDQDDHVTSTWRWLLEGLGVARWHLSLSHDGGLAIAYVIAEGGRPD